MKNTRMIAGAGILLSLFLAGCQSSLVPSSETPSSETPSSVVTTSTVSTTSVPPSSEVTSQTTSEEPIPGVPDLFISEYIEGPSTNKVVELYNPTGDTVDLSLYTMKLFTNGRALENPLASKTLSGTLAAGETFVFYNFDGTIDTALQTVVNAIPDARKWKGVYADSGSTLIASFNGDDALALFKGEAIIDVFGVVGQDPGDFWSLTFANGGGKTQDVVMTRIPSVDTPSVGSINLGGTDFPNAFDPLEWSVVTYAAVPATHTVGTHTID